MRSTIGIHFTFQNWMRMSLPSAALRLNLRVKISDGLLADQPLSPKTDGVVGVRHDRECIYDVK